MRGMDDIRKVLVIAAALLLIVVRPIPALADASALGAPSGLALLELKITGDEFVMLQNNTGASIPDLSNYWLTAYNATSPVGANVSSSTQQLPATALDAGQLLLLSSGPMPTCGASVAGKLSVSLGDSAGFLQLSQAVLSADGAITQTPSDWVSWNSGGNGVIQNVPSNTKAPGTVFFRSLTNGSYFWQQAVVDASTSCQLDLVVAGGVEPSINITPLTLATTSPPATVVGSTAAGGTIAQMPVADSGLTAPQITELLPNPVGTGNDATDEFIELYNPNSAPFDLSGFALETGTTTLHTYTFPEDTLLPAQSFQAFYSSQTKLGLSNTAGQATLLDPFGSVLSTADPYAKAKDGEAWALASGKWSYTIQPTPGKANIIQLSAAEKVKAAAKASTVTSKPKTTTAATPTSDTGSMVANLVHPWVLAAAASGALLYGVYEYRRDVANGLFKLRAKLRARRALGQAAAGRRGD